MNDPRPRRESTRATDLFAGGLTRTVVAARHALLAPDGFVPGAIPGWPAPAVCLVVFSPALGTLGFTQLHAELPAGATGGGGSDADERERFVYVLAGEVELTVAGRTERLATGGYGYAPTRCDYRAAGVAPLSRLLVFEKPYAALPGVAAPPALFGHERDAVPAPFLGDPAAQLATLLPTEPTFDLAVNLFRFAPGAALPFVETHVMEHGLLMLSGRGIYRLENAWYPVQAGDAIWMAPYCPQWFGALGPAGASYIYYKDVNRTP
jgi:(S)-ureidoglycine aminohydrolase